MRARVQSIYYVDNICRIFVVHIIPKQLTHHTKNKKLQSILQFDSIQYQIASSFCKCSFISLILCGFYVLLRPSNLLWLKYSQTNNVNWFLKNQLENTHTNLGTYAKVYFNLVFLHVPFLWRMKNKKTFKFEKKYTRIILHVPKIQTHLRLKLIYNFYFFFFGSH